MPVTIEDLPEEILLQIFQDLDVQSVARCHSVCSTWNRVLQSVFRRMMQLDGEFCSGGQQMKSMVFVQTQTHGLLVVAEEQTVTGYDPNKPNSQPLWKTTIVDECYTYLYSIKAKTTLFVVGCDLIVTHGPFCVKLNTQTGAIDWKTEKLGHVVGLVEFGEFVVARQAQVDGKKGLHNPVVVVQPKQHFLQGEGEEVRQEHSISDAHSVCVWNGELVVANKDIQVFSCVQTTPNRLTFTNETTIQASNQHKMPIHDLVVGGKGKLLLSFDGTMVCVWDRLGGCLQQINNGYCRPHRPLLFQQGGVEVVLIPSHQATLNMFEYTGMRGVGDVFVKTTSVTIPQQRWFYSLCYNKGTLFCATFTSGVFIVRLR